MASASQFKFYYCVIEPSSGAVEERRSFFTDLPAFIGLKNPISLQVAPEVSFMLRCEHDLKAKNQ